METEIELNNLKEAIKYNVVENFPSEGVKFIDFMPTFTDINLMTRISLVIDSLYRYMNVDYIVMPESRGYIIGSMVAKTLGVNMLPIRKHGKLPKECISGSVTYQTEYSEATLDLPKIDLKDKVCLFIDDVYAVGGTFRACKQLVEEAGGYLIAGVCLYDVGLDNNTSIFTFLNKEDIK